MNYPKDHTPPRFALRFLRRFCPPQLFEEIEGDLLQKFEKDVKLFGEKKAKRRLVWNVLRFFRPGIILRNRVSTNLIANSMIKSHLLLAIRLLSRNKAFALVSVFGLSVSIAASILIADYAGFELSYDRFFSKHKSIYRLQHNRIVNGALLYKKAMSFPEVGMAMKDYFPEVEQVARLFPVSLNIEPVFTATTKSGETRSFSEPDAYLADSSFCKIFDLKFIHGNPTTALSGADKIILSRSAALRYFGELDVVGQTLRGNAGDDVIVTGVFNDLPANSHFKFDVLLSWFTVYGDRSRFTWDGFYNYVLLKEGTNVKNLTNRFPEFAQSYLGDYYKGHSGSSSQFELQPLETIHLDSHLDGEMQANGNRNIVYALLIVVGFIIFIAVSNHVNLNTSRSLERIKEVGIRKTIGSTGKQLSAQFLCESLLLNSTAAVIGLLAAWLLYPSFNELFNSHISLSLLSQGIFWIIISSFILSVSIISGFYPAFILTRFKVFEALKGLTVRERKSRYQWSLVTIQFTISLILIVGTYVMFEQINFMQTKDLGFGIEQKLVIKILPGHGDESDSSFNQKIQSVKNELMRYPFYKSSTISSSIPGRKNEWRGSTQLSGRDNDVVIRANLTRVDEDFIKTFDLRLLAGRNYFSSTSNESSIILNAEAARQLGFSTPEEALGKKVVMFRDREIIGVVESFHETGLHEALSPSLYITGEGYTKFLTISLTIGKIPEQIETFRKIWKSQFPDKPFQYFFLDEFFNRQYQADVLMSRSISLFSSMAISIACLGLFSLSAYTIYRKTKEIGIKKILGASVVGITKELCQNFMVPIGLSALVGIPISYYLVTWWLEQYSYRVDITLMLFIVPLLILITIGVCTVIFQSIRAARKNPVDSLRYE